MRVDFGEYLVMKFLGFALDLFCAGEERISGSAVLQAGGVDPYVEGGAAYCREGGQGCYTGV